MFDGCSCLCFVFKACFKFVRCVFEGFRSATEAHICTKPAKTYDACHNKTTSHQAAPSERRHSTTAGHVRSWPVMLLLFGVVVGGVVYVCACVVLLLQ